MKHFHAKLLTSGLGAVVLAMSLGNQAVQANTATLSAATTGRVATALTASTQQSTKEWVALTAGAAPGTPFKATVNNSLSDSRRFLIFESLFGQN